MKEKIKQTAIELFRNYGLKSVSMDDIAREAGISKKTLYIHVQDKKTLIHETLTDFIQNDKSRIAKLFTSKSLSAIDKMLFIHKKREGFFRKIRPTVIYDLKKYYRESWDILESKYFNFIREAISENIKQGQKEGIYRLSANPDIIARLFLTKMHTLRDEKLFPLNNCSKPELYEQHILYHMYGVVNGQGHEILTKYLEKNQ